LRPLIGICTTCWFSIVSRSPALPVCSSARSRSLDFFHRPADVEREIEIQRLLS
jgi:hypothetical protein